MAVIVWVLLCLLANPARSEEPLLPPSDRVPVVLDGRVLFEVGESGTWSPMQRAAEINRILRAAGADPEPVNLVIAEQEGYPTIRMGDWHLLTVTDSDVLPGMDPGEQAHRWLQSAEEALLRARVERSAAYLAAAALRVLGVLGLAAAAHWLLGRISRRLIVRLTRGRTGPLSQLGYQPAWQLPVELARAALQAAAWAGALLYAAEQFPATRQLRYQAARTVGTGLRVPLFTMNERSYAALDVLWLIGAVALLWMAVSISVRVLSSRLARATGAPRGTVLPVATLLQYSLIFAGVIVILQVAGLNLSSLAIFASVLGVGIGFGLQSIANNFVSGVILSFERPIKPGDFVSVGALKGTVLSIGARSTIIRTLDRVSIIVPNSRLLETEVVNWSYGDELSRMHLPVSVVCESDIGAARTALLDAAKSHPAVLTEPRPEVRLLGFSEGALNLELLAWNADPSGQALLQSDLYYRIEANLRRAGVEIPQSTLEVSAGDLGAAVARRGANGLVLAEPSTARAVSSRLREGAAEAPGSPGDADAAAAADELTDIDALVAHMRGPGGLTIEDRRHLFAVYPKCFVGSEAVAWLMRAQNLPRDAAVRLGQSLLQRGVFHHVLDEHPFLDGNFFYRFSADEAAQSIKA